MTGIRWITEINDFIKEFFAIPNEFREEKTVQNQLTESLLKLKLFDVFLEKKIDYTFIIEFLKIELIRIPSKVGKYLIDGITVSSLMPARPIPFKIIYLVGLNESSFPGIKDSTVLDLRNADPMTGDLTRPEANNYLFLETLLTVKEKLYLSYISKISEKYVFLPVVNY